jgi:hypothetical protein
VALDVRTSIYRYVALIPRKERGKYCERDHHALCICLRAPTFKLLKKVMAFTKTWHEL